MCICAHGCDVGVERKVFIFPNIPNTQDIKKTTCAHTYAKVKCCYIAASETSRNVPRIWVGEKVGFLSGFAIDFIVAFFSYTYVPYF